MYDRPVTDYIFKDRPLNVGKANPITAEIPMGGGEGIFAYLLEIAIALVVGSGTGAKSEGELAFIPNISFATDLDKESHNAAARALYRVAHFIKNQAPAKDAIAAADGTYRVTIPLIFADEMSLNPFDSILDTKRYKACEMVITLGTVADLLSSVGTAAVTATMNLSVVKTGGRLDQILEQGIKAKPLCYPFFKQLKQTAYTDLKVDLSRQADLRLRRLLWMLTTASTAGTPFSGTPADDSINKISIEHGDGYEFKKMIRQQLADEVASHFNITRPTGWYAVDFMKDGDLDNSFLTDPNFVSKLEMNWETESVTAAMVNPIIDGALNLKPLAES